MLGPLGVLHFVIIVVMFTLRFLLQDKKTGGACWEVFTGMIDVTLGHSVCF